MTQQHTLRGRSIPRAALVSSVTFLLPWFATLWATSPARALDWCTALGPPSVCHTCLHGVAGPYHAGNPVMAQPVDTAMVFLEGGFTHYVTEVVLPETSTPGEYAGALLQLAPPALATGEYGHAAWWLSEEVEVTVAPLDDTTFEPEAPLTPAYEEHFVAATSPDCTALGYTAAVSNCHEHWSYLIAFRMEGDRFYRVTFRSTTSATFSYVFEHLDAIGESYVVDADGDGIGAGDFVGGTSCATPPPGHAFESDDCDDADASVYPGAAEVCDGIDNDCDGDADDGGDALCASDPDGVRCVAGVAATACGCVDDDDCPVGVPCELTTGRCEPTAEPDAGVAGVDDAGLVDAGVVDDAGGPRSDAGGALADAGPGRADGGVLALDAGAPEGSPEGGCSCRVSGGGSPGGAALAVSMLMAALAGRRRRKRAG